jgi:hypothetical protein
MAYKAPQEAYLEFEDTPFFFDVVEKESLKHTATATEHPVEEGANVSDHVKDNLDTVLLDVFVSNTPVRDVNNLYNGQVSGLELKVPKAEKSVAIMPGALMNAGLDALSSLINGPEEWKAIVLQFPEKFDNVAFVLNTLLDWKSRGVVGKVITTHRTYPSVYITGVEMNRDATTGDGAAITIELKEIRIVEAKLITAPIPTEERGKTMKSKGRQPTSFVRDLAPKRSLAKQLLG